MAVEKPKAAEPAEVSEEQKKEQEKVAKAAEEKKKRMDAAREKAVAERPKKEEEKEKVREELQTKVAIALDEYGTESSIPMNHEYWGAVAQLREL